MQHYTLEQVKLEELNPQLGRRAIHGDSMTVARLYLAKGAVVPRHHHVNEQMTVLLKGRLLFQFDGRELEASEGDVVQISANEPHRVEALEDSLAVDVFSPVREDWVRGDDAYLRQR